MIYSFGTYHYSTAIYSWEGSDMIKNIQNSLTSLGLNENQIGTYLALLRYDSATASILAKETNINRTTIYDNLSKLVAMGLVSQDKSSGKMEFVAESPDTLKNLLNDQITLVEQTIFDLTKIFSQKIRKPKVFFIQGTKGYHKMHEMSLMANQGRRTRYIGDVTTLIKGLSKDYINSYVQRRIKSGIRNQVLTTSGILEMKEMYSKDKNMQSLRDIKYLPTLGKMNTALFNYDNTVWITPTPMHGYLIMIENSEFAETFNTIFDLLWVTGKKVE